MASAVQLNSTAAIVNGQGLNVNSNLLDEISTYQNQNTTIVLLNKIYTAAVVEPNIGNVIVPIINTIGSGVRHGEFLLDIYPSNITPTVSKGAVVARNTGNIASAIGTIKNEALGAFAYGMSGFANTFSMVQGHASNVFDTIASIKLLKNKTYAQSGIAYGGLVDLVTGGVGIYAPLLANLVASWGTMYNVTNINLIADPYVFGQNLLNQNLGSYGNLSNQLTAAGLDTSDITNIPKTTTTTTAQSTTVTSQTAIGDVELPSINNVVVTNTVTGNSPAVVLNIYKTVTGSNLTAIISATGFTGSTQNISTLADLLDINKVIDPLFLPQVTALGVTSMSDLANYLNSRVSQRNFKNWSDVAQFFNSVDVPVLKYTTTKSSDSILSPSAAALATSPGTGQLGNPIIVDYLGATAGIPYSANLHTINTNYSSIVKPVYTALQNLDSAVQQTYTVYYASGTTTTDPDSGATSTSYADPDPSFVTAAVVGVNSAMNNLPNSTALDQSQTAYYYMLNHLTNEVNNLGQAGALFATAPSSILLSFGQRVGSLGGPDHLGIEANVFIKRLITNDAAGDTIRAAISETINNQTDANDPKPQLSVINSLTQNTSLTTYLSQNK